MLRGTSSIDENASCGMINKEDYDLLNNDYDANSVQSL